MSDCKTIDGNNNRDFICGVVEGFYGKPWSWDQRKNLFKKLKRLGLNSYMYAPKDDSKHRAKWRELYSDDETIELNSLIQNAKANGIDFYYSLAPGLDMKYSNLDDIDCLLGKYEQVLGLGCECFAILFDDIEVSINDKDKEVFKNYAAAQISTANMVYDHLSCPKFLFCPTEYCESRAVPNLKDSPYLKAIGQGLFDGIDIMWTGNRVVSRLIKPKSIDNLTKVIKRAPVIWENLHANDYDKKRLYLGPYLGRSTAILSKLRGILTNPNCEYEANHVAIHTLSQWASCNQDSCEDNNNSQAAFDETIPKNYLDKTTYDPNRALLLALTDWLNVLREQRPLTNNNKQLPIDTMQEASQQLCKAEIDSLSNTNVVDMVDDTQLSNCSSGSNKSGAMDTSSVSVANLAMDMNSCDSCEMPDEIKVSQLSNQFEEDVQVRSPAQHETSSSSDSNANNSNINGDVLEQCGAGNASGSQDCQMSPIDGPLTKHKESSQDNNLDSDIETPKFAQEEFPIRLEHLSLLSDLFFLPFQHGSRGSQLVADIRWLKKHCNLMLRSSSDELRAKKSCSPVKNHRHNKDNNNDDNELEHGDTSSSCDSQDFETKTRVSWLDRSNRVTRLCDSISRMAHLLTHECPNKPLVAELSNYLVDIQELAILVLDYIKFLRCRSSEMENFEGLDRIEISASRSESDTESSQADHDDEQEPWVQRGGLIGDIHRVLIDD